MEDRRSNIKSFRDLAVYQLAFRLQQEVYRATKSWPREETDALIDQVRRSSRSIGSNIAEAWAKRRYPSHFFAKLTDADGELQETEHWLETARACQYVDAATLANWTSSYNEVGRMLGSMMAKHETFCLR